jgi:hypothetical protein
MKAIIISRKAYFMGERKELKPLYYINKSLKKSFLRIIKFQNIRILSLLFSVFSLSPQNVGLSKN